MTMYWKLCQYIFVSSVRHLVLASEDCCRHNWSHIQIAVTTYEHLLLVLMMYC